MCIYSVVYFSCFFPPFHFRPFSLSTLKHSKVSCQPCGSFGSFLDFEVRSHQPHRVFQGWLATIFAEHRACTHGRIQCHDFRRTAGSSRLQQELYSPSPLPAMILGCLRIGNLTGQLLSDCTSFSGSFYGAKGAPGEHRWASKQHPKQPTEVDKC